MLPIKIYLDVSIIQTELFPPPEQQLKKISKPTGQTN